MHLDYRKEWSHNLQRDMEYKVYGHAGKLCVVFPAQDGRFFDYENFGMVDILAPEIEQGRLQLLCVDSMDKETFSDKGRHPRDRMVQHERWYRYVMEECIPAVRARNPRCSALMATGCSMGGAHAANFYFRAPQVFDTVIAQSGIYHMGFFLDEYSDDLTYINSPIDCLPSMPESHPFMEHYRKGNIIISVGQGAWEDDLLASTRALDAILQAKGIPAWVDYWGYDVNHDWPWWKKQIRYFVDALKEQNVL